MKNLLIIGAGQYGMVAKEIAESMKCFEKIDFVDDVYASAVGKICDIDKLIHEYDSAVVAIGNTELRLNLIKGLCEIGSAGGFTPRRAAGPTDGFYMR